MVWYGMVCCVFRMEWFRVVLCMLLCIVLCLVCCVWFGVVFGVVFGYCAWRGDLSSFLSARRLLLFQYLFDLYDLLKLLALLALSSLRVVWSSW